MKLFIPVNSNNLSSLASTLSLSPCTTYDQRDFGFRRSTQTKLSQYDNILVAFSEHFPPFFHDYELDNDQDGGYPMYIEFEPTDHEFSYSKLKGLLYTSKTLYFFKEFRLHFRNQNEQAESHAKLLKVIEAKYYSLIKRYSVNSEIKEISDFRPPQFDLSGISEAHLSIHEDRVLDRIFGITLCGAVAALRSDQLGILELLQNVVNLIPMVIDRSRSARSEDAIGALQTLKAIINLYEQKYSRNKCLAERYAIPVSCLEKPLEDSKCKTLGDTLMQTAIGDDDKPFLVNLYMLKDSLEKYAEGIQNDSDTKTMASLGQSIKSSYDADQSSKTSSARAKKFRAPFYDSSRKEVCKLDKNKLNNEDGRLLSAICAYLVDFPDGLPLNPDRLWPQRMNLLKFIVEDLKKRSILSGDDHPDLIFLRSVYKGLESPFFSLKDLQSATVVVQSLAILFVHGRDISAYVESCMEICAGNILPGMVLWGVMYGATTFPKTMTGPLCDNHAVLQIVLNTYSDAYSSRTKENRNDKEQLTLPMT